jgi:hypothetical protein
MPLITEVKRQKSGYYNKYNIFRLGKAATGPSGFRQREKNGNLKMNNGTNGKE